LGDLDISMTNYIEAFHNRLKAGYLYDMQMQRVDVLLGVLVGEVLPDLNQSITQILVGKQPRKMDKVEKARWQRAQDVAEPEKLVHILRDPHGQPVHVQVRSFSSTTWYSLPTRIAGPGRERALLLSCSCVNHMRSKVTCKHLFTAQHVTGYGIEYEDFIVEKPVVRPTATATAGQWSTQSRPALGDVTNTKRSKEDNQQQLKDVIQGFLKKAKLTSAQLSAPEANQRRAQVIANLDTSGWVLQDIGRNLHARQRGKSIR